MRWVIGIVVVGGLAAWWFYNQSASAAPTTGTAGMANTNALTDMAHGTVPPVTPLKTPIYANLTPAMAARAAQLGFRGRV